MGTELLTRKKWLHQSSTHSRKKMTPCRKTKAVRIKRQYMYLAKAFCAYIDSLSPQEKTMLWNLENTLADISEEAKSIYSRQQKMTEEFKKHFAIK